MVVCPLCEEAQPAGDACRVCGRPFAAAERRPLAVEPVPGLEPTRLEDAGPAPVEQVPGLEPTRVDPAPDASPDDASWVERTRAEDVGAVGVDPVEVERIVRAAPSPRAEDAPAVCRYCGEVAAAADAFCGRCGMRLQRVRPGPSR